MGEEESQACANRDCHLVTTNLFKCLCQSTAASGLWCVFPGNMEDAHFAKFACAFQLATSAQTRAGERFGKITCSDFHPAKASESRKKGGNASNV